MVPVVRRRIVIYAYYYLHLLSLIIDVNWHMYICAFFGFFYLYYIHLHLFVNYLFIPFYFQLTASRFSWLMLTELAFYPSLGYNLLRNYLQPSSWKWYTRIDDIVIIGALPFKSMVEELEKENIGGVVCCTEGENDFLIDGFCIVFIKDQSDKKKFV